MNYQFDQEGERKEDPGLISEVLVPVSKERASFIFVDNDARVNYGELYFSGHNKEQSINQKEDSGRSGRIDF